MEQMYICLAIFVIMVVLFLTNKIPMAFSAMIAMMLLRVVIAWGFIHLAGTDETGIWWAFVLSWIITLIFTEIHYFRGSWKKKALGRAAGKS